MNSVLLPTLNDLSNPFSALLAIPPLGIVRVEPKSVTLADFRGTKQNLLAQEQVDFLGYIDGCWLSPQDCFHCPAHALGNAPPATHPVLRVRPCQPILP